MSNSDPPQTPSALFRILSILAHWPYAAADAMVTATPPSARRGGNFTMKRVWELALLVLAAIVAGAIPAFAQGVYAPGVELQNYFSNASTTGGQAYVNIIAPLEGDTTGPSAAVREGETCAMIYVFNTEQSLQACCGCPVTADGLLTLNVTTQLAGNPVALGKLLQDGVIRIISTFPNAVPPPATVPPSTPHEYIGCDSNTQVCCDPTAVPAVAD